VSRDSSFLLAQQEAEVERERHEGHVSRLHESSYHPHGGGGYGRPPHHHEPAYLEFENPYGHHQGYGRHPYAHPYSHSAHHYRQEKGGHVRYHGRQPIGDESEPSLPEVSNAGYAPSNVVQRLVNEALHFASGQTFGGCAGAVQEALEASGVRGFMGCGNGWAMHRAVENSGKFERIPASEAGKGDLGFRRNPHGAGHAFVVVGRDARGQIIEASDHTAIFNPNNARYDETVFYRLRTG